MPHKLFPAAKFGLLIGIFLLIATVVPAQNSATASLAGEVRDAAGAAVSGAAVIVRDTSTNLTRQTVTDSSGRYLITDLPTAQYEVRVSAENFSSYVNAAVTLLVGQTGTLDITLQAGGVTGEVTVSEQPTAIDVTQTATTTSIDPERIEELPVYSRNYLQFTLTAPGVAPSNGTASGARGSSVLAADSGFTFGGLRSRSNLIMIDGLDNTDETTGAARVALTPEVVREFQVVNNGQSAEFGGAGGGTINVITRTGANAWHGTLFTMVQNEIFNAREPFTGDGGRPAFRRLQPGMSVGGPIARDKLFFYAGLEQEHLIADEGSEIAASDRQSINAALAGGTLAPRFGITHLGDEGIRTGLDETEASIKFTYLPNATNNINVRYAFTNTRERANAFNTDALTDTSARGSSYTKDHWLTGSIVSVINPSLVNDLRAQFSTRRATTRSNTPVGPEFYIPGTARFGHAFGGDSSRLEKRVQIVDAVSIIRGKHELRTGGGYDRVHLGADLLDGFGGIYVFRSVADLGAGRPTEWRQAFGPSHTQYAVVKASGFVQDHFKLFRDLNVDLGLRYDVERLPSPFRTDANNFAPRVGAAWSPSAEWVVRAGAGIFYDRLPLAYLDRAIQRGGSAFEQTAFDSIAAQIFAANGGGTLVAPVPAIRPSVYRPDPNFSTPYSTQVHAGVERLVGKDSSIKAEYLFTRGLHLPRMRNINLLPPVTLTSANAASLGFESPTPQQIGRLVFGPGPIDPRYDAVYQLENSASSRYHGLSLSFNRRLSDEITFLAAYTLSRATDDASDFDEQPQNPYDIRAERALSANDVRHRFVFSGVFDLPFGDEDDRPGGSKEKDSFLKEILANIEIAPIVTLSSGRPVNPVTGTDDEHSLAFPTASRPLGSARNSLSTPSYFNTDLRVVKYIPFGERAKLDIVAEAFNLFNRPNVQTISGVFGPGPSQLNTFTAPVNYDQPRQFRFSLDFEF